jgi:ribosomal-protein-alanine N-acetyltransferase
MSAEATPEIRTERLLLRPQQPADLDAIMELASRREVAATTFVPHPYSAAYARDWIRKSEEDRAAGRAHGFAITELETGRLVGVVGLHVDAEHRRAEIGYWIGLPFWGRGFATEAALAVTDYGFETLELERIFGQHFAENPGSGRVLEKAGFSYEGLLRGHVLKWGERKDVAIYGLMRSDRPQRER